MIRLILVALTVVLVAEPALARKSSRTTKHRLHAPHIVMNQGFFWGVPASSRTAVTLSRRADNWRAPAADYGPSEAVVTHAGSVYEPRTRRARGLSSDVESMIARHAAANGLPVSLVRRVVMRESGGNARASNRGALGIMQIKHATARGMGYTGSAAGLFDAETNMTYAVKYLAGAYRAAGGNPDQAVRYYASGYYHQAKRQGFSPYASAATATPTQAFAAADVGYRPARRSARGYSLSMAPAPNRASLDN